MALASRLKLLVILLTGHHHVDAVDYSCRYLWCAQQCGKVEKWGSQKGESRPRTGLQAKEKKDTAKLGLVGEPNCEEHVAQNERLYYVSAALGRMRKPASRK